MNVHKPQIIISTDGQSEYFQIHLNTNQRIIFSAPFGMGKTYFLNDFFKKTANTQKYNVFHLFPINYQLSSNEDIFELIKYDLLHHILGKGWLDENKTAEISHILAGQSYLVNNKFGIITNLMKCAPVSGVNTVGKTLDNVKSFISKYFDYYKKINEDNLDIIKTFGLGVENKTGSIYEFNCISQLIYETLQEHRENDQENVLIIDDLDRIDPEHIFRLLNVFSAHFDISHTDDNKFGFDKVIFVCDIENVRQIFSAKYGQNTDFSGYIDKFYTSRIFHFDNIKAIQEAVRSIVNAALSSNNHTVTIHNLLESHVGEIISSFVLSNSINLRMIFNLLSFNKPLLISNRYMNERYHTIYDGLYYFKLIQLLILIFGGDKSKLKKAFSETAKYNYRDIYISAKGYLTYLLPILEIEILMKSFKQDGDTEYIYRNEKLNLKINYNYGANESYSYGAKVLSIFDMEGKEKILSISDVYILFMDVINILESHSLV